MSGLLKAELLRLRKSLAFRLSLFGMLALACGFIVMQATAMDYTVPLSRVIFLPLSMYGIAMAAFVSAFLGNDFSDGFIRNKLLAADNRHSLVIAQILISCLACSINYISVIAFTAVVGRFLFNNDVSRATFFRYFLLGFGMCLSTGCLFAVITLVCGSKTRAVIWCMGLAFGMLFLCLHTNEVLTQTEYKNGLRNIHYVGGLRREICAVLHDLNPCGQAAQLSAWKVMNPIRSAIFNLLSFILLTAMGCWLFRGKDIR